MTLRGQNIPSIRSGLRATGKPDELVIESVKGRLHIASYHGTVLLGLPSRTKLLNLNNTEIRRRFGRWIWIAAPPNLQRVRVGKWGVIRSGGAVVVVATRDDMERVHIRIHRGVKRAAVQGVVPDVERLQGVRTARVLGENVTNLVEARVALLTRLVLIPGGTAIANTPGCKIVVACPAAIVGEKDTRIVVSGYGVVENRAGARAQEDDSPDGSAGI